MLIFDNLIFLMVQDSSFRTNSSIMSCLLCKKTRRILYNLYYTNNYGSANHTVMDDMIEIFGIQVEPLLTPDDFACNICKNMLDNVAKLKRRLWHLICTRNQECKPIKLGKIWDIFASLKVEEDDEEEPVTNIPCRTPTPSSLMSVNYSKKYNEDLEEKIASAERLRSLSRASSRFGRSDVSETSEVQSIFSKRGRRRRKGHNWTRHKRHAKSPATSEFSYRSLPRQSRGSRSDMERSYSPFSDCSYVSFYTLNKSPSRRRVVEYDDQGKLVKKRTRSVSRAQEEEAKYLERLESNKFYCGERECPLYFEDIDVLNHHKMMDHNILALYYCEECKQKYTTLEHLKLHKKVHDIYPFMCPLCAKDVANQEALQEHLEEHVSYSVLCKYCDKSFLSKKDCENHYKSAHSGRRERLVYKERIIMDRCEKSPPINDLEHLLTSKAKDNCNNYSEKEYVIHILPYTDMEHNKEDLDITAENFRDLGLDFILNDDDSSSDESELLFSPPKKSVAGNTTVSSGIDVGET